MYPGKSDLGRTDHYETQFMMMKKNYKEFCALYSIAEHSYIYFVNGFSKQ